MKKSSTNSQFNDILTENAAKEIIESFDDMEFLIRLIIPAASYYLRKVRSLSTNARILFAIFTSLISIQIISYKLIFCQHFMKIVSTLPVTFV